MEGQDLLINLSKCLEQLQAPIEERSGIHLQNYVVYQTKPESKQK